MSMTVRRNRQQAADNAHPSPRRNQPAVVTEPGNSTRRRGQVGERSNPGTRGSVAESGHTTGLNLWRCRVEGKAIINDQTRPASRAAEELKEARRALDLSEALALQHKDIQRLQARLMASGARIAELEAGLPAPAVKKPPHCQSVNAPVETYRLYRKLKCPRFFG